MGLKITAHFVAVFVGSLILMIGVEMIYLGPEGVLSGAAKWVGGILTFLMLAVLSLPVGLGLRWGLGVLPISPTVGAVIGGLSVGIGLVFILHPALRPSLSLASHPLSLMVTHALAGIVGGCAWLLVEAASRERSIG